MIKPTVKQIKSENSAEGLREQYLAKKLEYLELCWHYRLRPRLLTVNSISKPNIAADDRVKLIRLIIVLSTLERTLGPGVVPDTLFPVDEAGYTHSEMFKKELH